MRLGILINDVRGAGQPGELSLPKLAALAGGTPSGSTWHRYSQEPHPDDLEHPEVTRTPWGTIATRTGPIDAISAVGIADALRIADRTVWLAVGESIGLRNMFRGSDEEAAAKLHPGWGVLRERRLLLLRDQSALLVADQAREDALDTARTELADAQQRVAELEAENARLTRAATRARRRPDAG